MMLFMRSIVMAGIPLVHFDLKTTTGPTSLVTKLSRANKNNYCGIPFRRTWLLRGLNK